MSWAHPWWLLITLAILALAGLGQLLWRYRIRRRQRSAGVGLARFATHSHFLIALRQVFLWAGLLALAVAVAGPRWGGENEKRQVNGIDLVVAIDCSRSMLAEDMFPDRSRAARDKALDLLRELGDARLALLPFAGIATVRSPLTGDHLALAKMLEDCTPELFPAVTGLQGTAIGRAVTTGVDLLGREGGRGQAVLVISDGADPEADAVAKAAKHAAAADIPVYGLFIGDRERKATIQVEGRTVEVAADSSSLETLARTTGGITVSATTGSEDVRALADHLLNHLVQAPWEEERQIVQSERYRWALLPAIGLLTLGFLLPTARRRRTL